MEEYAVGGEAVGGSEGERSLLLPVPREVCFEPGTVAYLFMG
jgi:hypothetical protein